MASFNANTDVSGKILNFDDFDIDLIGDLNIALDTTSSVSLSDVQEEVKLLHSQSDSFKRQSQLSRDRFIALGKKIGELVSDNMRIERTIELESICDIFSPEIILKIIDKFKIRIETFVEGSSLTKRKLLNDVILNCMKELREASFKEFRKSIEIKNVKLNAAHTLKHILKRHNLA